MSFEEAVKYCDSCCIPMEGQKEYNRRAVEWVWKHANLSLSQQIQQSVFDDLIVDSAMEVE